MPEVKELSLPKCQEDCDEHHCYTCGDHSNLNKGPLMKDEDDKYYHLFSTCRLDEGYQSCNEEDCDDIHCATCGGHYYFGENPLVDYCDNDNFYHLFSSHCTICKICGEYDQSHPKVKLERKAAMISVERSMKRNMVPSLI